MTYVSTVQAGPGTLTWPPIPEGMNAIQIVAVARMVERVCGTAAAASYLAEAVAAFDKQALPVHVNTTAKHGDPVAAAATSPLPPAARW